MNSLKLANIKNTSKIFRYNFINKMRPSKTKTITDSEYYTKFTSMERMNYLIANKYIKKRKDIEIINKLRKRDKNFRAIKRIRRDNFKSHLDGITYNTGRLMAIKLYDEDSIMESIHMSAKRSCYVIKADKYILVNKDTGRYDVYTSDNILTYPIRHKVVGEIILEMIERSIKLSNKNKIEKHLIKLIQNKKDSFNKFLTSLPKTKLRNMDMEEVLNSNHISKIHAQEVLNKYLQYFKAKPKRTRDRLRKRNDKLQDQRFNIQTLFEGEEVRKLTYKKVKLEARFKYHTEIRKVITFIKKLKPADLTIHTPKTIKAKYNVKTKHIKEILKFIEIPPYEKMEAYGGGQFYVDLVPMTEEEIETCEFKFDKHEIFVRIQLDGPLVSHTLNTSNPVIVKDFIRKKYGLINIRLSIGGRILHSNDLIPSLSTVDVDGSIRGGVIYDIDDVIDYLSGFGTTEYTDEQLREALIEATGIDKEDLIEALRDTRPDILEQGEQELVRFLKQREPGELTINLTTNLTEKFRTIMYNKPDDMIVLIKVGPHFFTFSEDTLNQLIRLANGSVLDIDIGEFQKSDSQIIELIEKYKNATLYLRKPRHKNKRRDGQWYPFYHTLPIDLKRYGIYKNIEEAKEGSKTNCLLHAIKTAGYDIGNITQYVKQRRVPMKDLKTIAKILDIKITVTYDSTQAYCKSYGEGKELKLALKEDHYFLYDNETGITSWALKNYKNIKDKEQWWKYRSEKKKANGKGKNKWINSLQLVRNLGKFQVPIPFEDLQQTIYHDKSNIITSLDYPDKAVKEFELSLPKDKETRYIYFDCETTTDGKHKEYLVCSMERGSDTINSFRNCKEFLMSLKGNVTLIAHNIGYDSRFLVKYLFDIQNIIERGTRMLKMKGMFRNYITKEIVTITLKDSLALIPSPLKSFGKLFGLKIEKEVMPYKLYTSKNIKTGFTLDDVKENFDEKFYEQFVANCEKWGCLSGKHINHIKYSEEYCKLDVKVLAEGYEKHRKNILEVTGDIDIDKYVSAASVAHVFMSNAYEGCYEISGTPREFIQRTIVGGRVMSRKNEKQDVSGIIQDFDAVSLYPSAMARLGELGGYLKGKPKIIKDMTYEDLSKTDGYFVKINVKNVGKRLNFPLLNRMEKNKNTTKRVFSNDIRGEIYVDKISLEDLIKFQKIEFDIIEGYYFDEGRNPVVGNLIRELFQERLRQKKLKNPIQATYKLMMNSSYGKTILKPVTEDKKVVNNEEEMLKFLGLNANSVKISTQMAGCDKYVIKSYKSIVEHYSMPQIGTEILSMSKRIMNEVMCLAEEKDCKIYYQDTDSMHIDQDDVSKLSAAYKEIYGKELIGKKMGQFHCDFDDGLKGAELIGETDLNPDYSVWSVRTIVLGKKCYIDELRQVDKGKIYKKYHIRMKGISTDCIYHKAEEEGINPVKIYENLLAGKTYEFDLTKAGPKFEFHTNYEISSRESFIRKIKF